MALAENMTMNLLRLVFYLPLFISLCGCSVSQISKETNALEILNTDDLEFGKILRKGRSIELTEWTEIIQSDNSLEPMMDRAGINPFTQEKITFSGKGKAFYHYSGEPVGNIALENGVLLTTGVPWSKCFEIANIIGAVVEKDDRS